MFWLFISLKWYLYLLIIGIIFVPIANLFFKNFFDRGYVFAKTIGILAVSYIIYFLATFQIIPFSRQAIFIILALFAGISIKIWHGNYYDIRAIKKKKYLLIFYLQKKTGFICPLK